MAGKSKIWLGAVLCPAVIISRTVRSLTLAEILAPVGCVDSFAVSLQHMLFVFLHQPWLKWRGIDGIVASGSETQCAICPSRAASVGRTSSFQSS